MIEQVTITRYSDEGEPLNVRYDSLKTAIIDQEGTNLERDDFTIDRCGPHTPADQVIGSNKAKTNDICWLVERNGRKERYESLEGLFGYICGINTAVVDISVTPPLGSNEFEEELTRRCLPQYESGYYQAAVRNAFTVLEERIRNKGNFEQELTGTELVLEALNPEEGELAFGETKGEKDGVMFLYRGAFQALRNPVSHRFMDEIDDRYAYSIIHTVDLLIRLLDENS